MTSNSPGITSPRLKESATTFWSPGILSIDTDPGGFAKVPELAHFLGYCPGVRGVIFVDSEQRCNVVRVHLDMSAILQDSRLQKVPNPTPLLAKQVAGTVSAELFPR